MRKMDKDGLLLCELQAMVFEQSVNKTNTSSEIFIRRFMHSDVAKLFDTTAILDDTLDIQNIFDYIEDEYGKSNYGNVKYNSEVLYWIGYIYRYFSYKYNQSTRVTYKLIKPKELKEAYYVYHTFDPGVAIDRLLEEKNISFDITKQNERLLKLLRKQTYEREMRLCENVVKYNNKNEENKIYYDIIYKCRNIGELTFTKIDTTTYEIYIYIISDQYRNRGIGSVVCSKAIILAKELLNASSLIAKMPYNDEKSIHLFKKFNFNLFKEDENFIYYRNNKL